MPALDDKTPDEISLDYDPWQPGSSTFVVVREDGSVKLVRYDRHHLTVSEHQEGVLAPADVAEFFTTIRTRTVTRALRLRKRYIRDWGDADLFYLTSRTAAAEQTHWFSAGERAPQTIFSLVEKLLGVSKKIKSVSPGNLTATYEPKDCHLKIQGLFWNKVDRSKSTSFRLTCKKSLAEP